MIPQAWTTFGRALRRVSDRPGAGVRILHVTVLGWVAVAQPMYDLLGRNADFFVARRSQPTEVVLFAVLLLLAAPAVAGGLHVLSWVAGQDRIRVHTVLVGALVAVMAMPALAKTSLPTVVAIAVALALGGAGAAAYRVTPGVRLLLTLAVPLPLVAAGWFLLGSPVRHIVNPPVQRLEVAPAAAQPVPVVFVVLDEFPSTSLLGPDLAIDAKRLPGFARLAAASTWYPNASTVEDSTPHAIPALLASVPPKFKTLPLASVYPRNLFGLLARTHRLDVSESISRLCPPSACPEPIPATTQRFDSLFRDLSTAYLHIIAPDALDARLPSVSDNFVFDGTPDLVDRAHVADIRQDQSARMERFLDRLQPAPGPTLHYLHLMLPHVPWRHLPSGRRYDGSPTLGVTDNQWGDDAYLVRQGLQRHLMQVGYVDLLMSQLVGRLKAQGMWEDSLVVVTSDHGAAFEPGRPRRNAVDSTADELAAVPLFIKYPGQRAGRIDTRNVQTVDVLPTVADALDVDADWPWTGTSLLDLAAALPADKQIRHYYTGERVTLPADLPGKAAIVRRNLASFAKRDGTVDLFAPLPGGELVGRRVSDFATGAVVDAAVELDAAASLRAVDPDAPTTLCHLTGSVRADRAGSLGTLAVAVNGQVETVGQAFDVDGDKARLSLFVPERSLRRGANDVAFYAVEPLPSGPRLRPFRAATTYMQPAARPAPFLRSSSGQVLAVVRTLVSAEVTSLQRVGGSVVVLGWAADRAGTRLPDAVVLFVGEETVHARLRDARDGLAARLGDPTLARSGFRLELPASLLAAPAARTAELYVILDGLAQRVALPPNPFLGRPQ